MASQGSPLTFEPIFAQLNLSIQKLAELHNAIELGEFDLTEEKKQEHKADIIRILQKHFEEVDDLIYRLEQGIRK